MSEVGALIIKLQAETAQFREDMGKVKSDLNDLKGTSEDTGQAMDHSFTEARGGMMLTEEVLGVRIPRHLNNLIAQIPGVGAAFALMLPIAGVFLAVEIISKLIEKHKEMIENARQLQQAESNFGVAAQEAFTKLDDKMLQAGIKADELAGNHLGALKKQLVLIDHQSMHELMSEFDALAERADKTLSKITEHWYESKIGVDGVKSALSTFQQEYDKLLATPGKEKDAGDLLKGTLDSAIKAKELMEAQQGGHGSAQSDLDAQNAFINLLQTEVGLRERQAQVVAVVKKELTDDAVLKVTKDQSQLQRILTAGVDAHAAAVRKLAQTQAEAAVGGDKGNQEESIDGHLAKSLQAIEQEREAAVAAATQILASKKVLYESDLKAAGTNIEKKKELNAQYKNDVRASNDIILQADADANKKTVAATAAAAQEKARIEKTAAQQSADDTLKIAIDGAKQKEKITMEQAKNEQALHNKTSVQTLAAEVAAVNASTQTEVKAYNDRIKNLDKFAIDYEKKAKAMQDKITQIEQAGNAQVTQLRQAALQKQLMDTRTAEDKMANAVSEDIAKSIFEHKNMAKSFEQLGQQMIEGMVKQLLMMELTHNKEKLINAKGAFDKSFNWASSWGGPIAGAIAGATAFTAVMAFEQGGKIPGAGAVPIVGHGGETVVTRALTDRVEAAEGKGGAGHTFNIDARGADAGVEGRLLSAIRQMGHQAVSRSVAAVQDRAGRRA